MRLRCASKPHRARLDFPGAVWNNRSPKPRLKAGRSPVPNRAAAGKASGMDFWSEATALLSVIAIDLVLAGDNAVVVGMAAAGLPAEQRRRAVLIGIAAAAGLRIVFAVFATQLLDVIGLLLAGGLLLLWVSWKLWREIQAETTRRRASLETAETHASAHSTSQPAPKTLRQAIVQIVVADVSMSLDNVLAVAGAARDHVTILVIGLALSVALMGLAATFIAGLLQRFHWISYVGLAIIAFVAMRMVYEGGEDLFHVAREAGMF
jgi:YjbE family integral membrane protein